MKNALGRRMSIGEVDGLLAQLHTEAGETTVSSVSVSTGGGS